MELSNVPSIVYSILKEIENILFILVLSFKFAMIK